MAKELKIVTLLGNNGDPSEYTVADDTAIVKGELMEKKDASTATKVSGAGVPIAGIAATDKGALDGTTKMAVITHAVVTAYVLSGGSATLGAYVRSGGADNSVTVATTLDNETGKTVGKSEETGTSEEQIDLVMNL